MPECGPGGTGRTTATVLFTDLVASTELRSRIGEGAAEAFRHTHDRLVTDAISANAGTLIKHLGDGVMATFPGATGAVLAAVQIQQALARYNRSAAGPALLEIRVGLSAGDVTMEAGDCFGTPVIEAARLCAAARGGQILAGDVVRLLGGAASGHEFAPEGQLELKGLAAPLAASEVVWHLDEASSVPLPILLTDLGRVFVGREVQLDRLEQLWKRAVTGERRMVFLSGEPGVGKTRLTAELGARVHAGGGLVLAGRCDEDLGVPYQPFVEALRYLLDHTATPRLPDRLGRFAGELTRLVPDLAHRLPGLAAPLQSDPETERYRLFDAVAAWLSATSAEEPLLLVLDDLQWGAKPTLLLLRHILRSPETMRLLIVATYRDSDLGRGHPLSELLPDLRRDATVDRLPITGLDQSEVAAYIEAAAGHAMAEHDVELLRAIWTETEGNPFFVSEVLRHLVETGAVEVRDGRWTTTTPVDDLGIPEGVRDVVGRRLNRLSEQTNQALTVASVVGLEFEPSVVCTAAGQDEATVLAALEEAVAARLLTELRTATLATASGTPWSGSLSTTRSRLPVGSRCIAGWPKRSRVCTRPTSTTNCRPLRITGPARQHRRRRRNGRCTTPAWPATEPWPNWPTTKRPATTRTRCSCWTPAARGISDRAWSC